MNINKNAQDQAVKDLQLTGEKKRNNMHMVFFSNLAIIDENNDLGIDGAYNARIIYKDIDELCEEIFMGGKNTAKEGLKNPLKGVFKNSGRLVLLGRWQRILQRNC